MEWEEIQKQGTAEEQHDSQELIATEKAQGPVVLRQKESGSMDEDCRTAQHEHGGSQPELAAAVTGCCQFRQKHAWQPDEQQPFVPARD